MGKGDNRRPTQVDDTIFEENWRRAFGRTTQGKPGSLPVNRTCDDDLPDRSDYTGEEDA